MKAEWREYFSFSRSQRRFIALFAFVLVALLIVNFYSDSIYSPKALDFTIEKDLFTKISETQSTIKTEETKPELFDFNPNKLDRESWKKLGLTDWQINMIYNFEAKVGAFKSKADFAKLYCISEEEFTLFEPYILLPDNIISEKPKSKTPENLIEIEYFYFNPNNLAFEEWPKLGVDKKTATSIVRFREKGGVFYKKEDLLKIYTFDTALYYKLESYIVIDSVKSEENSHSNTSKNIVVEINTADSLKLLQVKGIGAFRAKVILEYRNKLGGFYSLTQLKEVYGIDEEAYDKISPQLTLNQESIKKINLNTCTFKELLAHPYTEYYHVQELMKYRDEKGKFTELPNHKTFLFEFSFFEKMLPYLSID
jgi:competence protein ComEA